MPDHDVPAAPAEDVTAGPLTALLGVATLFSLGGQIGFRRRDIG